MRNVRRTKKIEQKKVRKGKKYCVQGWNVLVQSRAVLKAEWKDSYEKSDGNAKKTERENSPKTGNSEKGSQAGSEEWKRTKKEFRVLGLETWPQVLVKMVTKASLTIGTKWKGLTPLTLCVYTSISFNCEKWKCTNVFHSFPWTVLKTWI